MEVEEPAPAADEQAVAEQAVEPVEPDGEPGKHKHKHKDKEKKKHKHKHKKEKHKGEAEANGTVGAVRFVSHAEWASCCGRFLLLHPLPSLTLPRQTPRTSACLDVLHDRCRLPRRRLPGPPHSPPQLHLRRTSQRTHQLRPMARPLRWHQPLRRLLRSTATPRRRPWPWTRRLHLPPWSQTRMVPLSQMPSGRQLAEATATGNLASSTVQDQPLWSLLRCQRMRAPAVMIPKTGRTGRVLLISAALNSDVA